MLNEIIWLAMPVITVLLKVAVDTVVVVVDLDADLAVVVVVLDMDLVPTLAMAAAMDDLVVPDMDMDLKAVDRLAPTLVTTMDLQVNASV